MRTSPLVRRRRFLASFVAAAALGFGARRSHGAPVGDRELVLGTHLPLSGPGSVATTAVRNGLQMRVDEANEAGGIHGRQLRLVLEDSGGQPAQAVRAVDKLVRRDGVFALVCPWGSGTNMATIKRLVDSDVLCFSPFAASSLLRQAAGGSPLLFTTNLNYDTTTAAGMAWLLARTGRQRVGFIYDDSAFGEAVGKGLQTALAARGLAVAAAAGYKPGEIDLSPAVARMQAANVDMVLCASGTRETIAVCNEVRRLGWGGVDIATAMVGRNGLTAALGKAAVEGLYGIGAWRITPSAELTAAGQAFHASYRKRFGIEADDVAMSFYSQADWLLQEVQASGRALEMQGLVERLQRSSYRGLVSYDAQRFEGGHVAPEWVRVEQIAGGTWAPRSEVLDPARARS